MSSGCGASEREQTTAQRRTAPSGVGSIGRIQPDAGTFVVSATGSEGRMPVVAELRVSAGDEVKAGQVIAVLADRTVLDEAVREAEARLSLARAREALVKAGPPAGDAAVIRAEIARLEGERDAAERDVNRNQPLLARDYVSKAQMDALQNKVRDIDGLIRETRQKLDAAVTGVRPEDIAVAEREVHVAETDLARARENAREAIVRAPARGRVLRVIAHPGESAAAGIVEMADTSRMVVMAEVYESDIGRVHLGEKAAITSDALPHPLEGEVAWISSTIDRSQFGSDEPGAAADARVYRVKLRVPDQSLLAERINGKVDVVIGQ